MHANIVKTQIFIEIKYDLKGHSRSLTMTFLFNNFSFCVIDRLKKQMQLNIMKEQSLTYTKTNLPCTKIKFALYKDDIR